MEWTGYSQAKCFLPSHLCFHIKSTFCTLKSQTSIKKWERKKNNVYKDCSGCKIDSLGEIKGGKMQLRKKSSKKTMLPIMELKWSEKKICAGCIKRSLSNVACNARFRSCEFKKRKQKHIPVNKNKHSHQKFQEKFSEIKWMYPFKFSAPYRQMSKVINRNTAQKKPMPILYGCVSLCLLGHHRPFSFIASVVSAVLQ